jgi:multiple sugar transport system permease protein
MTSSTTGKSIGYTLLGLFAMFSLFPIWIVLKTALTQTQDIYTTSTSLFPTDPTFENFARVLGIAAPTGQQTLAEINLPRAILNSVLYTTISVSGQVLFSAMAAYAFARIRFAGRDALFILFLSSMMVPGVVLFIPNFVLIKDLGWLNTMQGLVAPHLLMTPFAIFFLRQFFLSTPRELEEAAKIDGASHLRIFWSVVLPVHKGAIATLTILLGISAWNDFLWPFLVGRDEDAQVIAVALAAYRQAQQFGTPDWGGLMAATTVSIIPVLILLIILGRKVVESLQFSGLK